MKQIARLDYLDIQIYDELKTTLLVPQKDEDGVAFNSTLFINDVLAHEIFELLKLPQTSSTWGSKVLYKSDSKEVFISSRQFQKSLQFKGLFFLRADAITLIQSVLDLLTARKIKFLVSRLDISFILRSTKIYSQLEKCDFKNLTQYTLKKRKEIIYYKAYNSRFSLVAYGKASQIKREKGTDYLGRFLKCYGLAALPDDLINLELRALGTDCCAEITEAIAKKIDPELLKTLMVAQATKRINFSPAIQNLLLKVSI
jgi:hypothetical protein